MHHKVFPYEILSIRCMEKCITKIVMLPCLACVRQSAINYAYAYDNEMSYRMVVRSRLSSFINFQ